MDVNQYILSFNFQEVVSQVESISRSYTEFGETIRDMSRQVQDDVESFQSKLSSISSTLNTFSSSMELTFLSLRGHLSETSYILQDIAKSSKFISENFQHVPQVFSGLTKDAKTSMQDRVKDVMSPSATASFVMMNDPDMKEASGALETLRKEAEDAVAKAQQGIEALDEAKKKAQEEHKGIKGFLEKEVSGARSGIGSIIGRASGGIIGGGLIGGALASMVLGYTEKTRLQAESGEILNTLEATGDKLFSGPMKKATKWFSQFQEKAQWYYGIGRKEIQGVMSKMVEAGYKSEDLLARFDKKLGEVGTNTVTVTLGLDKYLNHASGTAMQSVIKLTQDYGDTLKAATSNILNLNLAAQRSGAGLSKFVDSVMSGSAALAQYGIDLKDVVALTAKLEQHYENMGLTKQYAGQLATTAASGIASGISNFSEPLKMDLARTMGLGQGYEGLQRLNEGWRRVQKGEDEGFFIKIMQAMGTVTDQQAGGASRAVQIAFWQKQGLDNLASTSFIDAKASGLLDKLADGTHETKEQLKGLRRAFKTEGEQVSELQKAQRDIIKGMAEVGQGLLQIVGGILGVLVIGIRSIPALVTYAIEMLSPKGDKARAQAIMDSLIKVQQQQYDALSSGWDKLASGSEHLKNTGLSEIFKIFSPLKEAATADLDPMNKSKLGTIGEVSRGILQALPGGDEATDAALNDPEAYGALADAAEARAMQVAHIMGLTPSSRMAGTTPEGRAKFLQEKKKDAENKMHKAREKAAHAVGRQRARHDALFWTGQSIPASHIKDSQIKESDMHADSYWNGK
jgi:hypothetical protein